jgi:hypothetical protein
MHECAHIVRRWLCVYADLQLIIMWAKVDPFLATLSLPKAGSRFLKWNSLRSKYFEFFLSYNEDSLFFFKNQWMIVTNYMIRIV